MRESLRLAELCSKTHLRDPLLWNTSEVKYDKKPRLFFIFRFSTALLEEKSNRVEYNAYLKTQLRDLVLWTTAECLNKSPRQSFSIVR